MPNKSKQQELIDTLHEICQELGWVVGLLTPEDATNGVDGIIIGNEAFVLERAATMDCDVKIFYDDAMGSLTETEPQAISHKKRSTYH